jgi:alkanesulfonate monooxygenase SsuD/methylene tetrahydromethanopterin reductase-like flavin-dependent oxidoreductase (luciferase family)
MHFGVVPVHGPAHMREMIEQAQLCEACNFDSIWVEEHHASGYYWPTPLLALAALASTTERIILGTNILILPLYDPIHIAEQFAVLDIMTDGRVVMGTSIGDSAKEFAAFRVRANRRGQAFEEQLQIIRTFWEGGDLFFSGEFFHYEGITPSVLPMRRGGPPIWIGGWGPLQIKRAAELGDAWFPGPVADINGIISRLDTYEQHLKKRGIDPESRIRPLTRDVVIAENEEEAWKLAEQELLPAYINDYLASDHPLVGKDSGFTIQELHELTEDRFIIGNPNGVIEKILQIIELSRTNHFIFRLKLPGVEPDHIRKSIHIIGQEVLPELRAKIRG